MLWELCDLTKWKTKKVILKELASNGIYLDERAFRKIVENHNILYATHEVGYFIAHSSRGYKITESEDDIRQSALDYRKRAINQLVKYSKILKALGENANMKLEIKDGELIYE